MRTTGSIERLRGERGGAMVELAVLMLIFVPLILLPMYFQDAMRYKLDNQESVYSTAWDFAYGNYQDDSASSIAGSIESANRDIYKDLWPGSKKKAVGPWANFEWRQEITCDSVEKSFGAMTYPMLAQAYHMVYTKGGLVTCRGSINVENHYIPNVFLQEFAQKDLFEPGKNAIQYKEQKFGILVDPWCLQDAASTITIGGIPVSGLKFYQRVMIVWLADSKHNDFTDAWKAFGDKMESEDISKSRTSLETNVDNPTMLKIRALHLADRKMPVVALGQFQFWVSPFKDGNDDKYEETFNNRDEYYLGCKTFEPNCK